MNEFKQKLEETINRLYNENKLSIDAYSELMEFAEPNKEFKFKKTIYNVYVKMESQEQCDRMKQLCIDNELPYWKDEIAFLYDRLFSEFSYLYGFDEFFIGTGGIPGNKTKVTEKEFIELLKTK